MLFMTYNDRPFDDSWITLAINHHVESSILNRKQMIFLLQEIHLFFDIPILITRV